MNNLNTVETTVNLAGKEIHFVELELFQEYNNHNHLKVLVDFEELDSKWLANPVTIIKYIGEDIVITMFHKETNETNVFKGIVSNISFQGKHGSQNHILIQAISETVKLDGQPTMNSFVNKQLNDIVFEVVTNSGNGASVNINSRYKKPIEYISMYNETAFEFLNRLSYLYGENFFYDGTDIHFGYQILDDAIPIKYDIEMTSFNLETKLLPTKLSRYKHLVHDSQDWIKETSKSLHEATGYLKVAYDKSKEFFYNDAIRPFEAGTNDSDIISKNVDIEQIRTTAEMLVLSGTTQTCKIKIGKVIYVDFPKSMEIDTTAGNFLITQVCHKISQEGHYSNSFSGIRAALDYVPVANVKFPKINSERAVVVDNADPAGKGRVRVAFQWQSYLQKETHWIRIQTPDGGGTGVVPKNRGFVFIPEVGDEVMVGFENLDPSQPYVAGSLFPESKSEGGNENNTVKSIMTKSGIKIILNDREKSVQILDGNGCEWFMDGDGSLKLKAPNSFILETGEIIINATKNFSLDVAGNMLTNISKEINTFAQASRSIIATEYKIISESSLISSKNTMQLQSDVVTALGTNKITLHSDKELLANSLGRMNLKSTKAVHLTQQAKPVDKVTDDKVAIAIIQFRIDRKDWGFIGFDHYDIDEGKSHNKPFTPLILGGVSSTTKVGNKVTVNEYTRNNAVRALRSQYGVIPILRATAATGYQETDYYVPRMTMFPLTHDRSKAFPSFEPRSTITLDIWYEILEEFDKLELDYKKDLFTVSEINLPQKTPYPKTELPQHVTISCLKAFSLPQEIKVWAYPKNPTTIGTAAKYLAGKIKVYPNDTTRVRKLGKIALVVVDTQWEDTTFQRGKVINFTESYIQKAMNQALIDGEILTFPDPACVPDADKNAGIMRFNLDLTLDNDFKKRSVTDASGATKDIFGKFIYDSSSPTNHHNGSAYGTDGLFIMKHYPIAGSPDLNLQTNKELFTALKNKFNTKYPKYAGCFTIFCFASKYDIPNNIGYDGLAMGYANKSALVFMNIDYVSTAHELFHILGLGHTFKNDSSKPLDENQKFTFRPMSTNNLMDYFNSAIGKPLLWHWQWEMVNTRLK